MNAETVAEVKRLCVLVATTEINYHNYNIQKKESEALYGNWEVVQRWQGCDIYKNKVHFLIVYHYKNVLELYKPINF